jgi:CBS domain containing-hemolysin-like protein
MQMLLNKFLGTMASVVAAKPLANDDPNKNTTWGWVDTLISNLKPVLYAIMIIVAAAGAIYSIILGINLAKAEDTSKRDEAKKHLITVLVAVAITIALVLFFTELLPVIIRAFAPEYNPGINAGNGN